MDDAVFALGPNLPIPRLDRGVSALEAWGPHFYNLPADPLPTCRAWNSFSFSWQKAPTSGWSSWPGRWRPDVWGPGVRWPVGVWVGALGVASWVRVWVRIAPSVSSIFPTPCSPNSRPLLPRPRPRRALPPREVVSDVWWPRVARETAVGSVARLGRRPDWDRLTGVSFWPPSARPDSIRHCWSIRPCTTARSPAVPSWATRSSLPWRHTHWPPTAGGGGFFIVFATGGHIDKLPSNPSTTRAPLDS